MPLVIKLSRRIGPGGREFWIATIRGPAQGPELLHFYGDTPIESLLCIDENFPGLRLPLQLPNLHGNN